MEIRKLDIPLCMVGEGPVWDVEEQALYLVDVFGKKVHRHDPASGANQSWNVPSLIGSMAIRQSGGAIVALVDGLYSLEFKTGEIKPLAMPEGLDPRIQFNDGKVDRRGRFVVGSADSKLKEPVGSIYVFDKDQSLTVIDTGIGLSNGPCWSPDDKTFYFSDSMRHMIYTYDYDIETGKAVNRREWVNTKELGGIPDGATVDADGLLWMAICEGSKVVAFRSDGKVERVIDMPVRFVSSVMFGGPDLDLLYVTSIDTRAAGLPPEPDAGSTFVVEGLGTRGLPEPRYISR